MSTEVSWSSRQPESYGKTSYQSSIRVNKKAGVHSRSPEWIFHNSLSQFTSTEGSGWQFGAVTTCGQILQTQAHLSMRDILKYFFIATCKKMTWPAVWHWRSCVWLWSISPCPITNSLIRHLNCIQEQILLTLVQTGFWREICSTGMRWPSIKIKPIPFGTTFGKKERNRVQTCARGAVGWNASKRFQGTSCKMQYPRASTLWPCLGLAWLPPNMHWGSNGNKCSQEPKRVLKAWEKENWQAAFPSYCHLQVFYLSSLSFTGQLIYWKKHWMTVRSSQQPPCFVITPTTEGQKKCQELLTFSLLQQFIFFSLHVLQPWRGEAVKPIFLLSL